MEDESDDSSSVQENFADNLSDSSSSQENFADDLSDLPSTDGYDSDSDEHDEDSLKTLDSDTEDDDPLKWGDEDPPRNNEPFEGSPGPTFNTAVGLEVIVEKFIGDDFFQMIVNETNKYYNQNSDEYESVDNSEWVDVTVPEMKKWLGMTLLTNVMHKMTVTNPWSTYPVFLRSIFGSLMRKQRFYDIGFFLHFSDNSRMSESASRLHKVQKLIDYFPEKFKSLYKPSQDLSIVETIIPWETKLKIRSYNPNEIERSGLFVRRVHECGTGYVTNFSITEDVPLPFQTAVANLVDSKWHNLYIDNFFRYNYIKIAKRLHENKTRMCSPVKSGKKLMKCLKETKPRLFPSRIKRKGEILLQMSKFPHGEHLCVVSTIHNDGVVEVKRLNRKNKPPLKKPITVMDYNKCMTGVNTADKFLKSHPFYQNTKKWSKKVLFYVLNSALFNAYVLNKTKDPNAKTEFCEFVLAVAKIWIDDELCNLHPSQNSDESFHEDIEDIGDGSSYESMFDEPDSSD